MPSAGSCRPTARSWSDQKASLESLVEHLEDAVALFNPAGELLFTNPAMQSTFAAEQHRAAGERARRRRTTRIERSWRKRWRRADRAGLCRFGDDQLAIAHAVSGAGGELVGILLVVRNLAYVSQMQSTIAYSRKLVALGRLTAGIAHEVKNPLNAMMIHLELLRMKIRKGALRAGRRRSGMPSRRRPRGRGAARSTSA